MRRILLIMAAVTLLLCTGCTQRLLDFTIISSKNVDLSRADSWEHVSWRVKGTDTAHWILIFPTGIPDAKEAMDRAIESQPGAVALVDGVVSFKSWIIPFIYGQQKYIVEGSPLIDPKLKRP